MIPMLETGKKAHAFRLVVAASLAAIAGLGLFCGGVSAQKSRFLPATENPYCEVTTYKLRDLAEQALSTLDANGRPVIAVSAATLKEQPAYGRFLMAHECCHHSLGHVRRYREGLGNTGPQPFFYIAPALKQMELDADCCAVRMLKSKREKDGIEAARSTMLGFGAEHTGAYYPTGFERADNIVNCLERD